MVLVNAININCDLALLDLSYGNGEEEEQEGHERGRRE